MITALILSPVQAADSRDLEVQVRVTSDWGFGQVVELAVRNTGDNPTGSWRILLEYSGRLEDVWGIREVSREGGRLLVESVDWNRSIPPGGSIVAGFRAAPGGKAPILLKAESVTEAPAPALEETPEPLTTPRAPVTLEMTTTDSGPAVEISNRMWKKLRWPVLEVVTSREIHGNEATRVAGRFGNRWILENRVLEALGGLAPGAVVAFHADTAGAGPRLPADWKVGGVKACLAPVTSSAPDYAAALGLSFLFFEAQRSGRLPPDQRVTWRGDSAMDDGADAGIDLSGGYYDAGDHVKFAFPMASAMTLLAWGGIEYQDGFRRAGEWENLLEAVRRGADWLLKAHPRPDVFFVQVGEPSRDHAYWGPPEKMTMARKSFRADPSQPASDVAGEAAAALAAASLLFREEDPAYAASLKEGAKSLFRFAEAHRGAYAGQGSDSHYISSGGYLDELAWSAAWLFAATDEVAYREQAAEFFKQTTGEPIEGASFGWDDKRPGTAVLLARLTSQAAYRQQAILFLGSWCDGTGGVILTPGGLAWRQEWGSLRYAANAAFLSFVYADRVADPDRRFSTFGRRQIDYILGRNPAKRSYLIGFGTNYPRQPHHRSSHGSLTNNINDPPENRHILLGAMVGGPGRPDDMAFVDDRRDFRTNEVAIDFNAGLTSALARLVENPGGGRQPKVKRH